SLATRDVRGYAYSVEQDPGDKDLLFLGTELGLWVSFDGGGRWIKWTHGVPTVPVMDLVIHPRDFDLVVGTHGRALYVLDDIKPLRTLSEKTLAEPIHLYGGSDALLHSQAPEPGGFGLGAGEYRGENEPYGAILTFSLNDPGLPLPDAEKERERKREERQARREEAARSEEEPKRAGEPEKGKEEKKPEEKPPEVEIRIADASDKVIRTFTAPVHQGLNRVIWNLARDGFKQFPQEKPPQNQHPGGP